MQVHDHQEDHQMIMIKGKRSKRPRPSSPLALTMATTSSSTANSSEGFCFVSSGGRAISTTDVSGSSYDRHPSASSEAPIPQSSTDEEEEDMANCLILLARGRDQRPSRLVTVTTPNKANPTEVYQCKTCNKSFPSFQALGGHRASHKKPNKPPTLDEKPNHKPVFKEKQEELPSNRDENTMLSLQISSRVSVASSGESKSRVHECSICGAEFASGQALGGHMRRHRPITQPGSGDPAHQEVKKPRSMLALDLNLPAPEEDNRPEPKFGFGHNEQVIVFSASSLVDCHY